MLTMFIAAAALYFIVWIHTRFNHHVYKYKHIYCVLYIVHTYHISPTVILFIEYIN